MKATFLKIVPRAILLASVLFMPSQLLATHDEIDSAPKVIHVASEPDYPPFCIIDNSGEPDGFSVELFREATRAVGIKAHFKIGIWENIKNDLALGRLDALPLVGRTPEREALFDFSMPYLSLHGAVFVHRRNKSIQSLGDLRNKTVLVMKGDNAEEFLRRHNISENIVTTPTYEEAFLMLEKQEGDAILTQRIMGLGLIERLKIKNIVPCDFLVDSFRQDFCFAVTKGDSALLGKLNEGLSVVMANKRYNEIRDKWFAPEIDLKKISLEYFYRFVPIIVLLFAIAVFVLQRVVAVRTMKLKAEIENHKKTLRNLHEKQALLDEMEKIALVGGWEYNIKNKKINLTNGIFNILRMNPEDSKKFNWELLEYENPLEFETLKDTIIKAIETGTDFDLELGLICSANNPIKLRVIGQVEYENGIAFMLFGSAMDITRQKEYESYLKQTNDTLEVLVEKRTRELDETINTLKKNEAAMLYIVEDLNETTEELRNERKKLEAINKELESFGYSVSHDLRAPLRGITGFAHILLDDYGSQIDDEGKRVCQVICDSANRMGQLIDDLLAFSRLSRKEMNITVIDMDWLFRSVFEEVANPEERSRINFLVKDLEKNFGDLSLIRQVVVNLLSNAIKYSSKNPLPLIEVSCTSSENSVKYFIKDNGVGFNMQYRNQLFGVFKRLHSDKDFEGTGIGLANVQRIIFRHGGDVGAEGEEGVGATFWFSLPTTNIPL